MQITTNEDGYVENYALIGELENGIEVDDPSADMLEDFISNCTAYKLSDGKLIFDKVKCAEDRDVFEITKLRIRRETECFSVINRGQPWYALLTDSQKEELTTWYKAWLDVTETRITPEKPSWLTDSTV